MENEHTSLAFARAQRAIGIKMNILMGVSLSFALSLTGFLSSGHFSLVPWLISFALSTVLSLAIGFFLPVRKAALAACKKCALPERSIPALALDSLISDLFYTPLITFLMVALAFSGAKRQLAEAIAHGAPAESLPQLHLLPMFLHSLAISMLVGYALIFVLQPLYLKILTRNLPKPPESENPNAPRASSH